MLSFSVPIPLRSSRLQAERELTRKYLRGVHADASAASWADVETTVRTTSSLRGEPRMSAVFPCSGPSQLETPVSVRGEFLGRAVNHGEICLLLRQPRSEPVHISAVFVSDKKVSCTMPPSTYPGIAQLSLIIPDSHRKANFAAAPVSASPLSGEEASAETEAITFHYYAPFATSRLKPSNGPRQGQPRVHTNVSRPPMLPTPKCYARPQNAFKALTSLRSHCICIGGTLVTVKGSGFVQTGEILVSFSMGGVEQQVFAKNV